MVDLRTILLLMAVADLALASALWIGAGRRRDGIVPWASSLVARACGFGIIALATEPQAGAAALGLGLVALSITLQGAALVTYAKRHLPTWVHSAVVAAVALPTQLLANDPASAALFVGVVLSILCLAAAAIAWQLHAPAGSRARTILVACFGAAGGILLVRGLGAVFVADAVAAVLRPTGLGAVATLTVFAAAIGTTLAFLLLQKERAEGEVQRLATMDPLTGAYNRRTFHEIGERELGRARRAGQPLSIVMIDIDNFRAINDKYGSKVGDEVLQRFADLLRSALRKEDMVVRFGGDEFVVLLPEVPGPGAVVVAGRIRRAVAAAPIEVAAGQFAVTASLGVAARLDEGPESMDGLLDRAGSALSLAKERGRNRVVALSLGRSIAA